MSGEVNYDESITETAIASKAGGQAAEQQDDRDSLFADAGRLLLRKREVQLECYKDSLRLASTGQDE